jgi:hypothetical protein
LERRNYEDSCSAFSSQAKPGSTSIATAARPHNNVLKLKAENPSLGKQTYVYITLKLIFFWQGEVV